MVLTVLVSMPTNSQAGAILSSAIQVGLVIAIILYLLFLVHRQGDQAKMVPAVGTREADPIATK